MLIFGNAADYSSTSRVDYAERWPFFRGHSAIWRWKVYISFTLSAYLLMFIFLFIYFFLKMNEKEKIMASIQAQSTG